MHIIMGRKGAKRPGFPGKRGRRRLALLAARGYQLSMPHSGVARRIVETDLALFRFVARSNTPLLDRTLPPLSRSANHSFLWIFVAGGLGTWGGRFGKRAAIRGLGSIAVTSLLVNGGLKRLFRRPRPLLQDVPLARQLTRQPLTTSFPSGHAASASAFAVGATSELQVTGPPLVLLGGAVAYSRIYTGVHYPLDVLVGAGIGATIALLSRVPWPLVPPAARAPVARAERRLLEPNEDGSGLSLVVNPEAGPAYRAAPLEELRARLPRARIVERGEGDDLHEILERMVGDSTVLGVSGGDGSVNAAADVALANGRPLLLIPSGTLNHLARDLGIRSPGHAMRAFTRGEAVSVDVALIDGRPFLSSAGFGAYTEMVDQRSSLEAKVGRWPGHLLGALKAHFKHRPLTLTVDGREHRVWTVFIGNCHHEPRGVAPSWRPRLDDGLLDVRLVEGDKPAALLRLVPAVLTGRLRKTDSYQQWETQQLRVESNEGTIRLGRDGQTFDGNGRFTVEKRRQKLVVYAPHA
jgi:diacylglycerol kinase family enzyme/membrane-associated phospholipid phosphatase